jgi:hypothetical protein
MWEDFRDEARRPFEPARNIRGRREELRRLAQCQPIELLHPPPERTLLRRRAELSEVGAVELVCLAELVYEPDALFSVTDDVRRELRRDDDVDGPAVRLVEVEHPPEERLGEHPRAGIPLERHRDEVCVVAARTELGDELVREDLGSPPREGNLGAEDRDAHRA